VAPNTTQQLDENFNIMNGKLFQEKDVDVTLRRSCYDGMNLKVTPNVEDFEGRLVTGQEYSFRLDLQFVPFNVKEDAFLAVNTNKTTWMRLLLCDTIRTGFCSPFIEQGDTPTSEQTDLGGPMTYGTTGQVNEYGYKEGRALIGVKDGLHIFSRYIRWELEESEPGVYNSSVDITFMVPIGSGGFYFFLSHAIIFFDEENNTSPFQYRIDIADAAPNNVVEFYEPPQINTITHEFIIAVICVCCILGAAEIYLLACVIWYRNNQVLQLAQAPFLALLIICGMIVTGTVFVFMPTRNVYCNLRGLLIQLPLTLMAAILVGRLWRVYSTLRIAISIGDDRNGKRKRTFGGENIMNFLSALASVHTLLKGKYTGARRQSLRTKVTDADLLRVLLLLVLPQLIIQIVGISMYRGDVEIIFINDNIGRTMCEKGSRWPTLVGEIYIGLLFVMAIIVAYASRELPSVFNEKNAIFITAATNCVVLFFVLAMIYIFDTSITEPNVTSFLWIFMSLFFVVSTLSMIVIPKVRRAKSGERIVMSKLLDPKLSRRHSSVAMPTTTAARLGAVLAGEADDSSRQEGALSASEQTAIANVSVKFRPQITLNYEDPPPRRIERQLFALKELISEFTNDSLEGRHITLSLWNAIISDVDRLNGDLQSMDFTWNEGMERKVHGYDSDDSTM
jgi:hypothetical protein